MDPFNNTNSQPVLGNSSGESNTILDVVIASIGPDRNPLLRHFCIAFVDLPLFIRPSRSFAMNCLG
jgi:hypothetical protein